MNGAREARITTVATAALGAGLTIGLAGVATAQTGMAAAGGSLAGMALLTLLSGGWLDGLAVLAVSLPLPALYSTPRLRLSLALVVTALVLVAWVAARAPDRRPLDLGVLPRWAVAGLLAAVVLSAAVAEHRAIALRELANIGLFLVLLAMATEVLTGAPHRVRSLALVLGAVVGLCGALATLEAVGVLPGRFPLSGSRFYRATLAFEWPNELAMFIALALPFAGYTYQTARGPFARLAAALVLGAAVAGLAATFSRGSWVAVPAATLILLFVGERRFVLRVWIVALVAAVVLDLVSGGALRARATTTVGDWVLEQRVALTVVGLLMFRENPLVGVGPGAFGENLNRFGPQVEQLWDYTGSAHNGYVHMAAETGVLGLAALVALFGSTLLVIARTARHGRAVRSTDEVDLRRAVLWSFAIACAITFIEWPFAHGVGQLIMLVAAMGFALARHTASHDAVAAAEQGSRVP